MGELVSPATTSRALVVPEPLKVRPRPKEKVLDEDTYIDALSQIIKRDFYPDLPKLEAQLEWMQAEAVNDVEKMRELQQRMLASNRRPTTGRATPGRATPRAVPTPKGFETPSATPSSKPGATPSQSSSSYAQSNSLEEGEPASKLNLDLTLDKFIEKHTSEDDASFVGIMDKQHEKHLEKYDWVEKKSSEATVMLIEASKRDETGAFPAVQTWNYTVRNQLMYVPDGHDTPLSLMPPPPPGPPKAISHRNTRITSAPSSSTLAGVNKGDKDAVWSLMGNTSGTNNTNVPTSALLAGLRRPMNPGVGPDGKVDLANLLGTPVKGLESPRVGGYGFVATPSPAPGVDMSPMTTWGRLDGTPLLIDPIDTPLDLTPGPSFKVPSTPRREELGMRLADKAIKNQKEKANRHLPSSSSSSPYSRSGSNMSGLSAAGRSLMEKKMNAKRSSGLSGADIQLRASYNSPVVKGGSRSSSKGGYITPSPVPSPSPRSLNNKSTPSHSSNSITDDLLLDLNAPPPSTPKRTSITDDLLI